MKKIHLINYTFFGVIIVILFFVNLRKIEPKVIYIKDDRKEIKYKIDSISYIVDTTNINSTYDTLSNYLDRYDEDGTLYWLPLYGEASENNTEDSVKRKDTISRI